MSKKYTQAHEWLEPLDGGKWRIGITEYAQEQLGDIVMIELPDVGSHFAAEDECAVIESVKSASDVYAPLSGEVVAINEALADNPALVNEDAEGAGWLMEITPDNPGDADDMMDADAYQALVQESE